MYHLNDGYDLKKWQKEKPKEAKIRKFVLDHLKHTLLSPQPSKKLPIINFIVVNDMSVTFSHILWIVNMQKKWDLAIDIYCFRELM